MRSTAIHGISIHASAWEATSLPVTMLAAFKFQFTPPRGRRQEVLRAFDGAIEFQFTPPRGRRLANQCDNLAAFYFNSRLRVGGDLR